MKKTILLLLLTLIFSGCAKQEFTEEDYARHQAVFKNTPFEDMSVIRAAEKTRNYVIVLNKGNEMLSENPNNDELRWIMARVYSKSRAPELAFEVLNNLLVPEHPLALVEKARANLAGNQISEAHTLLDKAEQELQFLAEDKESAAYNVLKMRALAFDLGREHSKAQEIYKRLTLTSNEPDLIHNYGMSLKASKKYTQAIDVLSKIVSIEEYPQVRLAIATCYVKLGRDAEARNILEGYMTDGDINTVLGEV